MFSKMYSYSRLSSKFDGRNILVDVLQRCSGTPAEQAQKRKKFADVDRKKIADWAQNRKGLRFSTSEEKGCEMGWARTGAENQ